jgi:ankyrin repeat protein
MILEHVVKSGNVKALKKILLHSSAAVFDEIDKNGRNPLMLACFNGNLELITLLINNGSGTANKDNVSIYLYMNVYTYI